MSNHLHPVAQDVAQWLNEAIGRTDFGELTATVKLHVGRVPIVQLSETTSIKTDSPHAGSTGGTHENRDR